jgi:NitT/TauT family transport system permease protein
MGNDGVPPPGPSSQPPPAAAQPVKLSSERERAHSRESLWALRKALPRRFRVPFAVAMPAIVVALWCGLTLGAHPLVNELFLPSPVQVLRATLQMIFEHTLFANIWASMVRILISFVAAALVALPLGIFMGAFEPVNRLMEPVMAPLRYMPISAFIPLLILWLGIGESQKVAFLFLGVFVYLLPVVVTAIRAVPDELVQTALTLGASKAQVIRTVLVPAALPDIFDSFRVMNAISWTYVILAEFVNARSGLGYMIQLAGSHLKTAQVFSGILVIGFIGLLTDALIRGINHALFRWRETEPACRRRRSCRSTISTSPTAPTAATTTRRCAASRCRSPTSRAWARSSSSSVRRAAASRPSSRRWRGCCRRRAARSWSTARRCAASGASAAWCSSSTPRSPG